MPVTSDELQMILRTEIFDRTGFNAHQLGLQIGPVLTVEPPTGACNWAVRIRIKAEFKAYCDDALAVVRQQYPNVKIAAGQ